MLHTLWGLGNAERFEGEKVGVVVPICWAFRELC